MRLQFCLVLALGLGIPCGSLAEEKKAAETAPHTRDASGKAFDAFYAKIWPRKRLIEAELKKGSHEPWEGNFDDGSGFAGLSRSWSISRKAGYASNSRVLDMGRVEAKDDRIVLVSESPAKPWGLTGLEYVVVPWGKQVYLVAADRLLAFCNDVNSGSLRWRGSPSGDYLLRVEDFGRKPAGLPQVPEEYKQYLLKEPITGSITKVRGEKEDVAVLGERQLKSGMSVTLNIGKKDGVRTGMRFFPQREADRGVFPELFVISLTETQSEVLVCHPDFGGKKKRFKPGMRVTTCDPLYTGN